MTDPCLVTVARLDQELLTARQQLKDLAPEMAQIGFDNDPRVVGRWLEDAASAVTSRNFVIPEAGEPSTLYLWMNDFVLNTHRWFVAPFANGPERAPEGTFDWRDALIGDEIGGGLRVPELTLSGMRAVHDLFAPSAQETAAPPERSAVEDVVLLAAFELVDRGLSHVGVLPLRIAMSCSEEWRVCIWDTASADATVHAWRSTPD